MSDIVIHRGVGAPPPAKRGPASIYPFADLAVGDAFDVPRSGERGTRGDLTQQRVNISAINYGRRHGKKFATRLHDEHTVRVYRVA